MYIYLYTYALCSTRYVHAYICTMQPKILTHLNWRWWWRERCRSPARRWRRGTGRSARCPWTPCWGRWAQRWQSRTFATQRCRRRGRGRGSGAAWSPSGASYGPASSWRCSSASGSLSGTSPAPRPRTAQQMLEVMYLKTSLFVKHVASNIQTIL